MELKSLLSGIKIFMINRIKNIVNTEDKKRLMSNFFSLSVLQGANYILPLLTLPYLVRVLGVEYFGLLAFATAMITYFQILTDYGFDLTATREISIHRENKEKVVEIFSSVMTIKFILMFVSFFLLASLVFIFEKFSKDVVIYFLTFGIVIGQVLFPVWFFQGMERMKYITYLNILSKVIFTIAIFVFVQEQSDYYLVPFLTSIGFMIAGIWSLYLIKKEFGISFQLQTHLTIKKYFIDGWDVFVSRIFVSLYTTINILLLGFFTNHTVVGYYAIAEKIVNAVGGLFTPANQTIYPYMAKIYNKQKEKFFDFTKKVAISYLVLAIVMCIALYIFSEFIVRIISGNVDVNIMNIYYVLIFTLITIPFGPLFTQVLIIQKRNKEFNKIVRNTFILNMLIAPFLIFNYSGIGLAVSINIVYLYHVLYLFKTLKFQGEN